MEALGEFEQVLLFALIRLGDDAWGRTIRREIEVRTGRGVSPGAIYTAMDRLEQRGLVSSEVRGPTQARGSRRRKVYRLEPAGARALAESYGRIRSMADGIGAQLDRLADV